MEALKQAHKDAKAKVKAAIDLAKMQPDYSTTWEEALPAMLTFRKGRQSEVRAELSARVLTLRRLTALILASQRRTQRARLRKV